ncbi:RDD [Candidatus Nanopelagicaceae bacterium]
MHSEVSLGRRFAAITLDWLSSYLIAIVFFSGPGTFLERSSHAGVPALILFFTQYFLLVALQGASAGHRVCRMRIVNFADGGRPTILQALIRSVLMVIVITAVTYDENGRGIHERLSRTKIALTN